jgi:hypothetical protein
MLIWSRRLMLSVLVILLVGGVSFAADAPAKRPDWCVKGWECVPTAELADATLTLLNLRIELAKAKAKVRHFGWTIGPGFGAGGVVDKDFHVQYVPTAGVYAVFGWRF